MLKIRKFIKLVWNFLLQSFYFLYNSLNRKSSSLSVKKGELVLVQKKPISLLKVVGIHSPVVIYNKFFYLVDFKFFFGISFSFYFFMKNFFLERIQKHLIFLGFNGKEVNCIMFELKNSCDFLYRISNGNPFSVLGFLFIFSQCLVYILLCEFSVGKKFILELISFLVDLEFNFWFYKKEYSLNLISNFFFFHFPSFYNSLSFTTGNFFYSFFLNLIFIDPRTKIPCRVFFRGELSSFIQFSFIYLFQNSFSSFFGFSYFFNLSEITKSGIILLEPKIYTGYMDLGLLGRSGLYLEIDSLFFLSIFDLFRVFKGILIFSVSISDTLLPSFTRDCFFVIKDLNIYFYGIFLFNNGFRVGGHFESKFCYFFHSKEGGVDFDFDNFSNSIQNSRNSYFFCNPLTGELKSNNDCIFQNFSKNYLLDPVLHFDGEFFHICVYFKYYGNSRFEYSYYFKKNIFFIKVHKGLILDSVLYLDLGNNFLSLGGSSELVFFKKSSGVSLLKRNILELEEFYGLKSPDRKSVFDTLDHYREGRKEIGPLFIELEVTEKFEEFAESVKEFRKFLKKAGELERFEKLGEFEKFEEFKMFLEFEDSERLERLLEKIYWEINEYQKKFETFYFVKDRGLDFYVSKKPLVSSLDSYNFMIVEFFELVASHCKLDDQFKKWVKGSLVGSLVGRKITLLEFGRIFDFNFGKMQLNYITSCRFKKFELEILKKKDLFELHTEVSVSSEEQFLKDLKEVFGCFSSADLDRFYRKTKGKGGKK